MGGKASVEECTSTDNQRVRDCCHLEGETPIEIRIAYQQPRPPQRLSGFAHAGGTLHPVGGAHNGFYNGAAPALQRGQFGDPYMSGRLSSLGRLRLPLAADTQARRQPSPGSTGDDDFNPDTFVAPPDSEGERGDDEDELFRQRCIQSHAAIKAYSMQDTRLYAEEAAAIAAAVAEEAQASGGLFPEVKRLASARDGSGTQRSAATSPPPRTPGGMSARRPHATPGRTSKREGAQSQLPLSPGAYPSSGGVLASELAPHGSRGPAPAPWEAVSGELSPGSGPPAQTHNL
eukprot:TRINITY_DN71649_c0_g1_i1.p2 TRINITY_DN71649_c0_g1~~TRINITY_DN71649_c0_g1_i1.p2  ORF type:complete len:289 (-),score=53.48 TRINITY_DN71649_c0_g1_i1:17-883(-)